MSKDDPIKLATATNRKPADELADIRERIRHLKAREDALRTAMLDGEVELTGDDFRAVISKTKGERLDTVKMKKELGTKFLKPYLVATETAFVRLKKMDDE